MNYPLFDSAAPDTGKRESPIDYASSEADARAKLERFFGAAYSDGGSIVIAGVELVERWGILGWHPIWPADA